MRPLKVRKKYHPILKASSWSLGANYYDISMSKYLTNMSNFQLNWNIAIASQRSWHLRPKFQIRMTMFFYISDENHMIEWTLFINFGKSSQVLRYFTSLYFIIFTIFSTNNDYSPNSINVFSILLCLLVCIVKLNPLFSIML